MSEEQKPAAVVCPFCGESDFDLVGLKMHLTLVGCEQYENLDVYKELQSEKASNP